MMLAKTNESNAIATVFKLADGITKGTNNYHHDDRMKDERDSLWNEIVKNRCDENQGWAFVSFAF